jgi:hypothetical protein
MEITIFFCKPQATVDIASRALIKRKQSMKFEKLFIWQITSTPFHCLSPLRFTHAAVMS